MNIVICRQNHKDVPYIYHASSILHRILRYSDLLHAGRVLCPAIHRQEARNKGTGLQFG